MILAGNWWEPTPPRPGSLDDCEARGFDPASVEADRAIPEPLDEAWQDALDRSIGAAKHLRDNTCGVPSCGLVRCPVCDERLMCTGPEPAVNTCGAHDNECVDCNGVNPCRDCADERRRAAA